MSAVERYDWNLEHLGGPEPITAPEPAATVDPEAVEEHVSEVFRGCTGLVAVSWWPTPTSAPKTETFTQTDLGRAAGFACGYSRQGVDVFVRSTTMTKAPPKDKRGGRELTKEFPMFHLDLDGAWGIHKTDEKLPATIEDGLALLDGFPQPTRIVLSGGGMYPLWLLEDPVDAAMADEVLPRWAAFWEARFNDAGYHLDPTAETSRVLRVPGLLNHKGRAERIPPRLVTLLDHDAPRMAFEDIVACLPELPTRTSGTYSQSSEWSSDPIEVLRRLGADGQRLVAEYVTSPDRGDNAWTFAPQSPGQEDNCGGGERTGWRCVDLIRPDYGFGPATSGLSARIGSPPGDAVNRTGFVEVFSGNVPAGLHGSHLLGMFLARAAFGGDRSATKAWLAARGIGRWTSTEPLADPEAGDEGVDDARAPLIRFKTYSATDLLAAPTTFEWLIRGCMVKPTFGQLGGEEKTLKSYLGTMMDISVATGAPFLGRFAVPEPARVLSYVGEGGRVPFTRRLQRIAQAMGINPADLGDAMRFSFDTAPIPSLRFQESLAHDLDEMRPGLVSVDPLYMFHGTTPGQSNGSNIFEEGPILHSIQAPCEDAGASLRVTHHFNGQSGAPGLQRLSQAGSKQWVDSWWLVSHREKPDVAGGNFKLLLSIGSRQWGGTDWDVDLHVGRFDEETGEFDGAITWEINPHGGADIGQRHDRAAERILDALAEHPWELTKTGLYELVRGNRDRFEAAVGALFKAGQIGVQAVNRSETGTGRTRKLLGLTPQPAPGEGTGWSGLDDQ